MFTLGAAVSLTVALALDVAGASRIAGVFAVAGIALLFFAVIFPSVNVPGGIMREPHFGHTRHGAAVHRRSVDHLPEHSAYARLNKRLAVAVTDKIGSMTCAWVFSLIALASLPAVLTEAFHLHVFPSWLVSVGLIALVAWVAQTYIQLVLLSVIMVGQRVGAEAGDARAEKTFDDVEALRADLTTALDRLDEKTEGGIKAVLDAVAALAAPPQQAVQMQSAITLDETQIRQLVEAIQANAAAPAKTPAKRLATATERGKATGK